MNNSSIFDICQTLYTIKYDSENNDHYVKLPQHISIKNDKGEYQTIDTLELNIGYNIAGWFKIDEIDISWELLHNTKDLKETNVKLHIEYKDPNDLMDRFLEEKLIKYIELNKVLGFQHCSKIPDYEKYPEEFFGFKTKTKTRMRDSYENASRYEYDNYENNYYDDNDNYENEKPERVVDSWD